MSALPAEPVPASQPMPSAQTVAPQLFSGSLRPFPGIPAHWSLDQRRLAHQILAEAQTMFPEVSLDHTDPAAVIPDADVEDFWEDACRASAAWRASGGNVEVAGPAVASSDRAGWAPEELVRRLGPVTIAEVGGHHARDRYIDDALFFEYSGRAMLLGTVNSADPATDVVTWLVARHVEHGVARAIVKTSAAKAGIWSVELDSDPAVVVDRLLDAMGWAYFMVDGVVEGLLVQDMLDLQYEYRLFVVDGEIVSGAGCVEELTPMDRVTPFGGAQALPFDARVRQYRGHHVPQGPSVVEHRPDVVDRLLALGTVVAWKHGGTVVIDVALDAVRNAPVVVELNELSNSGLYASDPWRVAERLVTARDRGYAPAHLGDLMAAIPAAVLMDSSLTLDESDLSRTLLSEQEDL